jgi:type I restriction enzyme S subunit
MSKWPILKLDKHISESKEQYESQELNGIQVLSVTNDQGFINSEKRTSEDVSNYKIIKENYFAYNPYRINVGSLAFAGDNYKGIVSPAYVVFYCAEDLDPEYLFRYLKSDVGLFHIRQGGKGSVRSSLSFKKLQEIEIPLPPLPEQNRIVAKIKEIESNAQKLNKQNGDRIIETSIIFSSTLNKIFSNTKDWESIELDKIAPQVTNNFVPSEYPEEEFDYLSLESIESYTSKLLEVPKVKGCKIKSSTTKFDQSNVLYAKLRPYLNKVIAPNFPGIATTELISLKPDITKIEREFLVYFLRNPKFVEEATKISAGTKMPRVNMKWLKKQKVLFPKHEEDQKIIINKLNNLENKAELLKKELQKTDRYINALIPSVLAKAFNGEL